MADSMMRLAARGKDGTAKPIKSENDGKLLVGSEALHEWGFILGSVTSRNTRGNVNGVVLGKGENEAAVMSDPTRLTITPDTLNTDVRKYFNFEGYADDSHRTLWVAIPIAEKGFRTFFVSLTHTMNIGIEVSAYLFPTISPDLSTSGNVIKTLAFAQELMKATELPHTDQKGQIQISPGGLGTESFRQTPLGYLVLKIDLLNKPTTGFLMMGVERQK